MEGSVFSALAGWVLGLEGHVHVLMHMHMADSGTSSTGVEWSSNLNCTCMRAFVCKFMSYQPNLGLPPAIVFSIDFSLSASS